MFELIALIIRAIEKMAEKSKAADPAAAAAWQAQQAEWERSRREWEARQLGLMAGGPRPPPVPAAAVPPIPKARPAAKATALPPAPARAASAGGRAAPLRFAGAASARSRFVLYEVLKPPLSLREPPTG